MARLTWAPLLPPDWLAGAFVLLVGLLLLAAWRTRSSWPAWANLAALLLRLLVLACLGLLILRPETIRVETRLRRRPLLLLVDDTQSLRLNDAPRGATRAESAAPLLAEFLAGAAARGWEVRAYDAGEVPIPRRSGDAELRARAGVSPLGDCLAEALLRNREAAGRDAPSRPYWSEPAAVVLISDGCVNRGRTLEESAGALGRRGQPLFAVRLGESVRPPPDLALGEAVVRKASGAPGEPPRAGQRLTVEASARLNAPPDEGEANSLARLFVAGPWGAGGAEFRELEALPHRLRRPPEEAPVRLGFTPAAPGLYRLRLALNPLRGERNTANNVSYSSVQVLPPNRRAACVASALGHDYRRLKHLFAAWDGPEVVMLADFLRDSAPAGVGELESLLQSWLDAAQPPAARGGTLVWLDPDPARLAFPLQKRLCAALEAGELNCVWVVNEPAATLAARLKGSPLAGAFLYGDLKPPKDALAPAKVRAGEGAREHPATRWAYSELSPPAGVEPWAALGNVTAWGEFAAPAPGVQVLLSAGDRPLLSVGRVGRGRVALLACGESWRWLAGEAAAARLAAGLWRRLLDWAGGAEEAQDPPVRLYLARDRWELGETLGARVAVRAPRGAPPGAPRLEYALAPLAMNAPAPKFDWRSFPGAETPGAPGELVFLGGLEAPSRAGEWLLAVRAFAAGEAAEFGADRAVLAVQGAPLEEQSVLPDEAGLAAAVRAAGAGGRVLAVSRETCGELLKELEPFLKAETQQRETRAPALSPAALWILLVIALSVEIRLRRSAARAME